MYLSTVRKIFSQPVKSYTMFDSRWLAVPNIVHELEVLVPISLHIHVQFHVLQAQLK